MPQSTGQRSLLACALLLVLASAVSPLRVLAQGGPLPRATDWDLERIELKDGESLEGVLLEERADRIAFVEITRRPGQPMRAVMKRIASERVVARHLLEGAPRAELLERYNLFRHRVRIELGKMESVALETAREDGTEYLVFRGEGFSLWSTANEEMTRRCVVRIEQMMGAYQQLVPPREEAQGTFRVMLHGSMDEYRGYLQRLGLRIDNPAFYSAPKNVIVAGSDLTRYARRLRQIRDENDALLQRYDRVLNPEFDRELARLSKQLRRQGLPLDEIAQRRAAWDKEYRATVRRINEVNRRNESKFAQVTERMFTRLYHEAFHAYLENHVFPHRTHATPRWLNEGLAQIFEGGVLEADALRVDSLDPDRLRRLQEELQSNHPLSLVELLKSDERHFLAGHRANSTQRHYVYSWGLAHYLMFFEDLLADESLAWYVSAEAAKLPPIERFERFVGERVSTFENRWRYAILQLELPP